MPRRSKILMTILILWLGMVTYHAVLDNINNTYMSRNLNDKMKESTNTIPENDPDSKRILPTIPCHSPDERIAHLKTVCHSFAHDPIKYHELSEDSLRLFVEALIVDEKHQLIYCDVSKAGSTTWKNILANNSDAEDEKHILPLTTQGIHVRRILKKFGLFHLDEYNKTDIVHRLDKYWKFMVARHPLTRLASGYRDKLTGKNSYYNEFIRNRIIPEFRQDTNGSYNESEGVNFSEFIQYMLKHGMGHDQHFKLMEHTCHPCDIQYNYIAKLETHHEDMSVLVKDRLSGFGDFNGRPTETFRKTVVEFDDITLRQISNVLDLYKRDMTLFGYTANVSDARVTAQCVQ